MATIPDRPQDSSIPDDVYKIGDKVYYFKAGRIAFLLTLHITYCSSADLVDCWRKGEVKDVDSQSSSNPVYHVRISEDVTPINTEVVG